MARLLCLDVKKCKIKTVNCTELQDYYDNLGCDCFDIAHRKIGNKYFDLFVDDEGLFKEDSLPSAVSYSEGKAHIELVGNIIFANHDKDGSTTDLTDDDIDEIRNNLICGFCGDKNGDMIPILSVIVSW